MTVEAPATAVRKAVTEWEQAGPDDAGPAFHRLLRSSWRDGSVTGEAPGVASELLSRLPSLGAATRGRSLVLLGLLAEADEDCRRVLVDGTDAVLALWRRDAGDVPTLLAAAYLLAHVPERAGDVLRAAADVGLEADDESRLRRALQQLDPERPELGRVFPAPSAWVMDDAERAFDRSWIASLTPDRIRALWDRDTSTVLGHLGAKAYWASVDGTPVPAPPFVVPDRADAVTGTGDVAAVLARHLDVLRCPRCAGSLRLADDGTPTCTACAATYSTANGIIGLDASSAGGGGDFLRRLSEMPTMGLFYEAVARPNFLRIAGSNWAGQVLPDDEAAYLRGSVRPVEGPVLDLGAGAGTWTRMIADVVGEERLIALDVALPMLSVLRGRLPGVLAVQSTAASLPVRSASLGAVCCWNALQAFPDDARAAVAEVGRCLRPGGTFTALTFRASDDPVYGHFQRRHVFPQHEDGLRLFDVGELRSWLDDAGLRVTDLSGPGTFVLLTAEKVA